MFIATLGPATEERTGDWHYRVTMPMDQLARQEGVYTADCGWIHREVPEIMERADIVVVNMVPSDELMELVTKRTERGQITVFELNDEVADIPETSGIPKFVDDTLVDFKEVLAEFDCVQFTTEELARRYGRYSVNWFIARNNVDAITAPIKTSDGDFCVGWGGSLGHKRDLAEIAPYVVEWVKCYPNVALALMCHEDLLDPFRDLYPKQLIHVPPAPIEYYYRFLQGLDVGIAPLALTEFNQCRSDVKFLEYSSAGAVTICKDMEPYRSSVIHEHNGLTYSSPDDLVLCLDKVYKDPDLTTRLRFKAAEHVRSYRRPDACVWPRIQAYLSLLDGKTVSSDDSLYWRLADHETSSIHGRHVSLRFGNEERDLWKRLASVS